MEYLKIDSLEAHFTLDRKLRDRIESVMATRRDHLERFAAAFVKQVGSARAAQYRLTERTEHHEGGMTVTWEFERIHMTSAIQDVIDAIANLDKQIEAIGVDAIKPVADQVFAAIPSATAIGWTQYTPYFNDGEACVFGVNGPDICTKMISVNDDGEVITEEGEALDYLDDYFDGTFSLAYDKFPNDDVQRKAMQAELDDAFAPMAGIPDEIMRRVFGDGVRVIIFRNGTVKVDEYDHD